MKINDPYQVGKKEKLRAGMRGENDRKQCD